jgi:protein-tyrosine phosphatase
LLREVEAAVPEGPRLVLGAEVAIDSGLLEELDRYPGGSVVSLAGSRYLLLEPPPLRVGPDLLALAHELKVSGWHPVLAHPERVRWLADDLGLVAELVEAGALLQLTAMSVTGALGDRLQERSRAFLDAGLAHFVASDSHDLARRPPGLRGAFQEIAGHWGEAVARELMEERPGRVVEDGLPSRRPSAVGPGDGLEGKHDDP